MKDESITQIDAPPRLLAPLGSIARDANGAVTVRIRVTDPTIPHPNLLQWQTIYSYVRIRSSKGLAIPDGAGKYVPFTMRIFGANEPVCSLWRERWAGPEPLASKAEPSLTQADGRDKVTSLKGDGPQAGPPGRRSR